MIDGHLHFCRSSMVMELVHADAFDPAFEMDWPGRWVVVVYKPSMVGINEGVEEQ